MRAVELDGHPAPLDGGGAGQFACTLLQERFWKQQKAATPAGLNIAMRWLVQGELSRHAAEGALQALVRRHEILRTSFQEVDGAPVQLVLPSCPLKLHYIDLATLGEEEATARADEIAQSDARKPIDPSRAPLLRATLLRIAPDRAVLLLTFHSMIADGWSTGLVVREFHAAAEAIEAGRDPDAAEPELQFADYALWEKELLASGALDESRAFWAHELRDVRGTEVVADHPASQAAPALGSERGHIVSVLVSDALGRAAEAFARQKGVTLFGLATAALAMMLHRTTGDREIVIGSQVANREAPETEDLIGPTVNSITLRLPVDDRAIPAAFLRDVWAVVAKALQHQRLPFEIAETLAERRDGKPLHAVNLVVHHSYSGTRATGQDAPRRFNLISLPSYSAGSQFPLNFYMIGRDEGWRMSCEADASLYRPETARGLVEKWQRCLEALVTSPDERVADGTAIPVHDPARQVVRFHADASKTPVVVLNNVSVYYQLARQLGEDRPFIDVQLYHPTGPIELPPHDAEVFAAYALRLIRWARPKGPYILGGHCVYGVLALEVARQLRQMGETVEVVALFDSWAPGYREDMSPRDKRLRQRRINWHARLQKIGQARRGEIGLQEITSKPLLRRLGLRKPEPAPDPVPEEGVWFDQALRQSIARYRPAPYDGDVVLFRSQEPLRGRLFDDHMGWDPLVTGTFTMIEVNSGHLDMFREEPAAQIASTLRALLAGKSGH